MLKKCVAVTLAALISGCALVPDEYDDGGIAGSAFVGAVIVIGGIATLVTLPFQLFSSDTVDVDFRLIDGRIVRGGVNRSIAGIQKVDLVDLDCNLYSPNVTRGWDAIGYCQIVHPDISGHFSASIGKNCKLSESYMIDINESVDFCELAKIGGSALKK